MRRPLRPRSSFESIDAQAKAAILHREETRHGLVAWYVRRGRGQRIRIKAEYGSPDFWAQYRAAVEGAPSSALKTPKAHTLAWAVERYRSSSSWGALAASTRRQWENVLRNVIKTAGGALLRDITNATVRDGRERRASTPMPQTTSSKPCVIFSVGPAKKSSFRMIPQRA
jgi:hypothetical protein